MIGRLFDDPIIQEDRKVWPFNIVNANGKLKIEVTFKGVKTTFFPEQISSMVLMKMKQSVEHFLGDKVSDAVITVPAYFNDAQRQATIDAGEIAGLKVLRIINEPTAAAIAYGFDEKGKKIQKVLVYDFGGGTFDVSILSIENGVFTVLAVGGDSHLGGQDIDNRIAKHLADDFERKFKKNLWENKRSVIKLLLASERAKRTLSSATEILIVIESLFEGIDFQTKMRQSQFNTLNADLFEKTINITQQALQESKLVKTDIDEIILIGGSTRIPKVQELVKEYFGKKVLNGKRNADESVAYGAAILAAQLLNYKNGIRQDIQLHDVTPHSLGIALLGNRLAIVIDKQSAIPFKKNKMFATTADNQMTALFKVYEGESPFADQNRLLGTFHLLGIPKAEAGVEKFIVTFNMNVNGILKVTAVMKSTKRSAHIVINKKQFQAKEMKMLIAQNRKLILEEEKKRKIAEARDRLEKLCDKLLLAMNKSENLSRISDKSLIQEKCKSALQLFEGNSFVAQNAIEAKEKEIRCLYLEIAGAEGYLAGTDDFPE